MEAVDHSLSWYPVSDEVKQLLKLAALHWDDTARSEPYIHQALDQAGDSPDVLIAAYRYAFYKNNNPFALDIANRVVQLVRSTEQLPEDWEDLKPLIADRLDDPPIRLFLNAYSASGMVMARMGDTETATTIAARVKDIDRKKEFGANTIFDILTNPGDDEDE
ncbi:MAG: hypothetical protein MUF49_24730 [Oculatellaceae cyanobacterium Prado106]|jgi:hypothetical protein|nr:hypothetical protein [Oculatellaceae cyanobacterium Prado106]